MVEDWLINKKYQHKYLQSNVRNWEETLTVQKIIDSETMTTKYNWEFVIKIFDKKLPWKYKLKANQWSKKLTSCWKIKSNRNPNSTGDKFKCAPID